MAITQQQLDTLDKHRKDLLATVEAGLGGDEYLIATYNRLIKTCNDRIPVIRRMVEKGSLRQESKTIIDKARTPAGKNGTAASTKTQGTQQKAS